MEPDESTRSFRCAPLKKKLRDVVEDDLDGKKGKDDVICALQPDMLVNNVSILINTNKHSTLGKGTYGIVRTGSINVNGLVDKNESAFKTFLGKDGVFFFTNSASRNNSIVFSSASRTCLETSYCVCRRKKSSALFQQTNEMQFA